MQASIINFNIDNVIYKIELDSHINIPVVDWNAYIMSDTGETADVNSCKLKMYLANSCCGYSSDYNDPYSGTSYILLFNKCTSCPKHEEPLIPSVMMDRGWNCGWWYNNTFGLKWHTQTVKTVRIYFVVDTKPVKPSWLYISIGGSDAWLEGYLVRPQALTEDYLRRYPW